MDPKTVESQLQNHKIREGHMYQRTKFLQEWRERWLVLTMNYLLIFTNRNLKDLVEVIDLREVKTYKSYLKKEEDMIPAGFKIRTLEDMFYFCARNSNEKWTWIASLERLMDFKYAGKSPYNNAEMIKTRGFMSQREHERGKFDQPDFELPLQAPRPTQQLLEIPVPKTESPKIDDSDLLNKTRLLDEQLQLLKVKEEEMLQRQKDQEESFLFELNKLKKAEESLREFQMHVEEKEREVDRIMNEGSFKALQLAEATEREEEHKREEEIRYSETVTYSSEDVKASEEISSSAASQAMTERPVDLLESAVEAVALEPVAMEPEDKIPLEQTESVTERVTESVTEEDKKCESSVPKVQQVQSQPSKDVPSEAVEVLSEAVQKQTEEVVISSENTQKTQQIATAQNALQTSDKPSEMLSSKVTEVIIVQQEEPQTVSVSTKKLETTESSGKESTSTVEAVSKIFEPKQTEEVADATPIAKMEMSKRMKDMKQFFESKGSISPPAPDSKMKQSSKKVEKKDDAAVSLHSCRDRVVVNLLEQFHPKAYNYAGLRHIIEFLIKICAERSLGYQSCLIREAKANKNRFLFAEVLLQLINDYKEYDEFVCIARIIEVLIFQAPGIFKLNHFDLIRRKLVDLVNNAPENHSELPVLLKTLYLVHKMKRIQKSESFKAKLKSISSKMHSIEGKNLAQKLIEDL